MKRTIKIISIVLLFCILFSLAQAILTPKFLKSSTSMMSGIYSRKTDDIDVLLIGSSQLYCSFDAQKLTEDYGIRAYDIGSGGMPLAFENYYLQEALKYKHPHTVIIEVGTIFTPLSEIGEDVVVYTFAPTKYSIEKESALRKVITDEREIAEYLYFPLLKFHSRWNTLEIEDFIYPFFPLLRSLCSIPALKEVKLIHFLNREFFDNRGFLSQSNITPVQLTYVDGFNDAEQKDIPEDSIEAIDSIYNICSEKGIKLIFIKTPTSKWTRDDSESIKSFMNQRGYTFLDLHDYINEMDIDAMSDFYDSVHLNCYGAEKATKFLADYLITNGYCN